jgi:hypothetical protein
MARPRVIYEAKPGSPLEVDRSRYERLAGETGRRLVEPPPELLAGWVSPPPSDYAGGHGLSSKEASTAPSEPPPGIAAPAEPARGRVDLGVGGDVLSRANTPAGR